MNNCSKCQELMTVVSIKTSDDLQQTLRFIQNELTIGDLIETAAAPQSVESLSQNSFSTLATSGPWPDVLQYYFRCAACGQTFSFVVETYHGAGGAWSPLN